MKPIEFPEQNCNLGRPSNMTDEECGSLPVFRDGQRCISKWALSEADKKHIAEKGYIYLHVYGGSTQPPVWIDANDDVFIKPENPN